MGGNQSLEVFNHFLGGITAAEAYKLDKELAGIGNGKCHAAVEHDMQEDVILGIIEGNGSPCSPEHIHLVYLIDIKHLAGEGTVAARGDIDNSPQQRQIRYGQGMPACTEQIGSLTVDTHECLERFIYNQLGRCIKLFSRILPYEVIGRALKLNYL